MDKVFRQTYDLRTFDVDLEGKAPLPLLLNMLQDAARHHSARLGNSIFDLWKKGFTWVISRYHVIVSRYPVMGESLEVVTWASAKNGLFALRDSEIRRENGEIILRATSSWVILSLETKQPVSADPLFPDDCIHDLRAVEDDFGRLTVPDSFDKEFSFRVLRRDLDFNRHANNVAYVHWALEAVPAEIWAAADVSEIEIVYKSEALFGEEILSQVNTGNLSEGILTHRLLNRNNGIELARLRTVWKKK